VTDFEPRIIPVPRTDDGARNWPAWREAMVEHIKLAQSIDDLRALTDANQESFAECCTHGLNAYRLICDALDKRRKQIEAGLPWRDE
jgi:hypothetical protein